MNEITITNEMKIIYGEVVDENGKPIRDALVVLEEFSPQNYENFVLKNRICNVSKENYAFQIIRTEDEGKYMFVVKNSNFYYRITVKPQVNWKEYYILK